MEKAILRFAIVHVSQVATLIPNDVRAVADVVQSSTVKQLTKGIKSYRRPLSNAGTDLSVAENVRQFLKIFTDADLPDVPLFPKELRKVARLDLQMDPTHETDQALVEKWSEFCKNARNMCLLARACAVMDADFLQILDMLVSLVASEIQVDPSKAESLTDSKPDFQKLMFSLLTRSDLNIGKLAQAMNRVMSRDPDMFKDCLGTILAILKDSGVNPPDIDTSSLESIVQGAMQSGFIPDTAASIAPFLQQATASRSPSSSSSDENPLSKLLQNLNRVDHLL